MTLCFSVFGLPPSQVIQKSESHVADSWADGRWVFPRCESLYLYLSHPYILLCILSFILPASCSDFLYLLTFEIICTLFCDLCIILANLDPTCFPSLLYICSCNICLFECRMIQMPGKSVTESACLIPTSTKDTVCVLYYF